ncbi:MAG: hypothetical protein A2167_05620 [Planctomycetes bacterium RBG_13_46_10]|nr:MAG: hypothetical protein A2167_05620 [Planctomycetes bacterium RBG_13_46_10]
MGRISKKICLAAGFLTAVLVIFSTDAVGGLAVSPIQQWVEVKPGKEAYFTINLTNTIRDAQALPCDVIAEVVDFNVSPQGGLSFGEDKKHDRSAVPWISFEGRDFTFQPGESKQIKAKVSAPINADGDYWAAIMIKLGRPEKQGKGIQVKLQTASGVFVHVARRNYIERGSIIDANLILPKFDSVHNPEISAADPNTPEAGQQAFTINVDLKNDGLTAFNANGKVLLYSGGKYRTASIPLYTHRRQILPGHNRWFTGVMAQALPAGQYKARVVFESEAEHSRKITKDIEFTVSNELASQWAENFTFDDIQTLKIEPQELKLTLTGGRFTAARFLVANQCLSTVSIRCRPETEELPEGWLKLESTDFTLNPNTRRNMVCLVRIPPDAEQGQYNGIILIEVERSGLTVQGQDNVELHKIPICIEITK